MPAANRVCVRSLRFGTFTGLDIRLSGFFLLKWLIESFEPLGPCEIIEMVSGKLLLKKIIKSQVVVISE